MINVKRYCAEKSDLDVCWEGSCPEPDDLVMYADFDRVTAERDAERRRADVAVADANAADAAGKKVSELLSNRTAERDAALETVALKQRDLIEAQTAVTGWARKFDALQALMTTADERADVLEQALKFYADREHYHFESGNWDTVSGEPLNILWNGDEPDFIEDGSVARAALKPAEAAKDEHVCTGCGSKGWTANCKECVPY